MTASYAEGHGSTLGESERVPWVMFTSGICSSCAGWRPGLPVKGWKVFLSFLFGFLFLFCFTCQTQNWLQISYIVTQRLRVREVQADRGGDVGATTQTEPIGSMTLFVNVWLIFIWAATPTESTEQREKIFSSSHLSSVPWGANEARVQLLFQLIKITLFLLFNIFLQNQDIFRFSTAHVVCLWPRSPVSRTQTR